MRKGICPKCGSTEIYHSFIPRQGGGIGWGGGSENSYVRLNNRWSWIGTEKWDTFLCTHCGYFENFIIDRDMLEMVKNPENRWVKVNQS